MMKVDGETNTRIAAHRIYKHNQCSYDMKRKKELRYVGSKLSKYNDYKRHISQ